MVVVEVMAEKRNADCKGEFNAPGIHERRGRSASMECRLFHLKKSSPANRSPTLISFSYLTSVPIPSPCLEQLKGGRRSGQPAFVPLMDPPTWNPDPQILGIPLIAYTVQGPRVLLKLSALQWGMGLASCPHSNPLQPPRVTRWE